MFRNYIIQIKYLQSYVSQPLNKNALSYKSTIPVIKFKRFSIRNQYKQTKKITNGRYVHKSITIKPELAVCTNTKKKAAVTVIEGFGFYPY